MSGARPSPAGQGDALAVIIAALETSRPTHDHYPEPVKRHAEALAHARALAARQPVNQCDGCRANMPVEGGIHRSATGDFHGIHMACQAEKYARQPVGEPVTVEAVATVRRNGDGDLYIDWLTEGGIADLEVGDVLMVSDRAITDEDGSGEVYTAPPAQAVDLEQFREAVEMATEVPLNRVQRQSLQRLLALIDSHTVAS